MRDVILLEGHPGSRCARCHRGRAPRCAARCCSTSRSRAICATAGRSDRIRHTIHYKRVFEIVEDVAGNQEHKLVEALGDRIARAVLAKFAADEVAVTVRKPNPIAGVLEHAGVRVTRRREDLG